MANMFTFYHVLNIQGHLMSRSCCFID